MPKVLVVHHTSSPSLDDMLDAVLRGLAAEDLAAVEVETAAALSASAAQVLAADGLVLGTPANMGYMSGGLKVFFDSVYYPCLRETRSLPYGLYVHGNDDVTGAVRSVERLAQALGWQKAAPVVEVVGPPTADDRQRLAELGQVVAATLL